MRSTLTTFLLRLYLKTIRVSFFSLPKEPLIIALWHRDLPTCIAAFKHKNIHVQISASDDAEIAHALCSKLGYYTHRGSTSALQGSIRELLKALKGLRSVGVALDGPHGPSGKCNKGVLWLYKQSNTPIVVVQATYSKSLRINSWDRMHFPLPFSKVHISLVRVTHPSIKTIEKVFKV